MIASWRQHEHRTMNERELQDALIVRLTQPDLGWRYAGRDASTNGRLAAAGVNVATDHPLSLIHI